MKRKMIFSAIVFGVVIILGTLCFANTTNNTNTVDLKGEITESLDKTRNMTKNVTNDVVSGTNEITNMKGINDNNGDYNTTRTSVDNAYYTGNTMNTTTWLWMILAIVAIIIVAAVWYYAMQGTNNRNNDDH